MKQTNKKNRTTGANAWSTRFKRWWPQRPGTCHADMPTVPRRLAHAIQICPLSLTIWHMPSRYAHCPSPPRNSFLGYSYDFACHSSDSAPHDVFSALGNSPASKLPLPSTDPAFQQTRVAMARARAQSHEFTDVHSWAASGVICPVTWMLDYSSQQEHLQLLMKRQHEAREAKKEPPVTLAESSDSPAGGSRL